MNEILETGAAALLFAATFLMGGRAHPFRSIIHDRRSIISFGAGMSSAYVFVHLMPELNRVSQTFFVSPPRLHRDNGMTIYFLALVGFLVFYGLDHLRARLRKADQVARSRWSFKLHLSGFAAYVWLMAYLLVHNLKATNVSTALYAVAIAFHFLTVDHALRNEHGAAYDRIGRFALAGMSLLGWGAGLLFAFGPNVLSLLTAFISGAIIMNSTIMELPAEKDGRFLPFAAGGVIYGLILLPLG